MIKNMWFGLYFPLIFLSMLMSCKEKKADLSVKQTKHSHTIRYAKGFSIERNSDYTIIRVNSAWPGATDEFTYALVPKSKLASITLPSDVYDAIVPTPVEHMIVSSTTHVPALEALDELDALIAFPNTDFISSPQARKRIDDGHIQELGTNENLNTEIVLSLNPEVIIGFGINGANKAYETLQLSGIPVTYNGDWTEQTPLGKAEWIKFFAPFFQKERMADSIFKTIETSYNQAKELAKKASHKPTVLTGGLYKDVWYVAGGKSWVSQFLDDAQANYLCKETAETGSIGLSLEEVLTTGQHADFWLNPSTHTTYSEMQNANSHYSKFDAFQNQKIFSNAIRKGETGGIIFYELAPQRPDWVLKDLISILHPHLMEGYETYFFRPLQ